jgi:hypothetical protein
MRSEAFIDGSFVAAADGRRFPAVSPRDGTLKTTWISLA